MSRKTILMIEDNRKLHIFNKMLLEKEGYVTFSAYTLAEARESIAVCNPDALILDIGMPDGNGLDFLRETRKNSGIPVLLLTGLGKGADIVAGFECGCNEYLTKPYTPEVLLIRLKYMLQSSEQVLDTITKGSLRLEITPMAAFVDGEDLGLSPKEFAVLLFLARHEDEFVPAEVLYERVWSRPMNYDSRTVAKTVSQVRAVLKEKDSGYTIAVQRNEGYCFGRE